MTDSQNDEPNLPEKIEYRVEELGEDLKTGDKIVGNGDIELTSEHIVMVVEYFLAIHKDEWAKATYRDYSYDLTRFLEYGEYACLADLSNLSSSNLEEFREWRKQDGNIGLATLHGQLMNVRSMIKWCERNEIVESGLAEQIEMPDLDDSDIVSYVRLQAEVAELILEYNQQFDYVTRQFAEFALIWGVLLRLGDVRSLDLEDYHRDEQYIELTHNREEETPLKNGPGEVENHGGERELNLPDWLCEILNTYIDGTDNPHEPQRIDAEDAFGRKPLFSTKFGRVSDTTLRRDLYRVTQPCQYGEPCPHDMDPEECDAKNSNNHLSKCRSNVSPHPVRRGAICYQLKQGVSKNKICGRADVSLAVLNRHYDLRTKEEARKQRRKELQQHLDGYGEPPQNLSQNDSRIYQELSTFTDRFSDRDNYLPAAAEMPSRARLLNGTAMYAVFVGSLAFDFTLMGL